MITLTGSIKNVLLIEDDPRNVELTLATLQEGRLADKVAVVENATEALDYLYRRGKYQMRPGGNPILVLLNLSQATVNGLEVLEVIKADECLKMIPVVALSDPCETPEFPDLLPDRFNAYVRKPVDLAEFIKSIEPLGPFWASVDEPPPPFSENTESPNPIHGRQRMPKTATNFPT